MISLSETDSFIQDKARHSGFAMPLPRMFEMCLFSFLHLCKAFAAIYRTVFSRLKRYSCFLAASCTSSGEHFPFRLISRCILLCITAALATLRHGSAGFRSGAEQHQLQRDEGCDARHPCGAVGHKKILLVLFMVMGVMSTSAQYRVDRLVTAGRSALYYEDFVHDGEQRASEGY